MNKKSQAIIWIILSCFAFATMTAVIRHLGATMDPLLMIFYRGLLTLLGIYTWICYKNKSNDGVSYFKTNKIFSHLIRAISGLLGMVMWFYCLTEIPLSEATALSFTVPLFSMIIAVIFLKEKLKTIRLLSLLIGFCGVFIILKPKFGMDNNVYYLVLSTTLVWAISNNLVKSLTFTEKTPTIIFYITLFSMLLTIPLVYSIFRLPTESELIWVLLLGFTSIPAQITHIFAYSKADVGVIVPFDFMRLIFAILYGSLFFNDDIYYSTIIGAAIIFSSSLLIINKD